MHRFEDKYIYFLMQLNRYPRYTPILLSALEIWCHDAHVTTPILKLFAELVQNRSQRLQFDVSSPNGILLFREASKVICSYGMLKLFDIIYNSPRVSSIYHIKVVFIINM